jgi:hypothetical protein
MLSSCACLQAEFGVKAGGRFADLSAALEPIDLSIGIEVELNRVDHILQPFHIRNCVQIEGTSGQQLAISEGYNPTIGIMHESSDGSSKFIFDLMEPERPRVDRAVLDFVKGQVFDPSDFIIRADGVCRLNPAMARMVVARVST